MSISDLACDQDYACSVCGLGLLSAVPIPDTTVKVSEPCRSFNRGKCNFGSNCKYEHRYSYCYKYGHGAVNCRKAQGDRGNKKSHGEAMIMKEGVHRWELHWFQSI